MDQKTTQEIVSQFIREFAKLNLELTQQIQNHAINPEPELLRVLRDNAQALVALVNHI